MFGPDLRGYKNGLGGIYNKFLIEKGENWFFGLS